MTADDIVLSGNSMSAPAREQLARPSERSRAFWIGLACAAVVHAGLIIGVARHSPRYLGEAGGSPDAINVELVDEADLRSLESVPQSGASAPPTQPTPPQQAEEVRAPAPKQNEAQQKAEQPAPQSETAKPAEAKPAEAASADEPASVLPLEREKPQTSPPQEERVKQKKAEAAAEATPKMELKPPEQLDLSVPFSMAMKAMPHEEFGSSSAVNRPPGITRSGENDAFGRGVIHALRKTMPPATGTKGRVTIKLILDERGNVASLKLVQGAGIRDLDDGVMFSAQQTSFPFPPKGSTAADRTFLITYVYK